MAAKYGCSESMMHLIVRRQACRSRSENLAIAQRCSSGTRTPRLTPRGADDAPGTKCGWTVPPSIRSARPQGEMRPAPTMTQPPQGLLPLRKVPSLRSALNPSRVQHSGTGMFPGMAPGTARARDPARRGTRRGRRLSAHPGGRQFLGYCHPGIRAFISKAILSVRRGPDSPSLALGGPGSDPSKKSA